MSSRTDSITLAAAGDAMITRRLQRDLDGIAQVADHLRDADVGFANLEVLLHDFDEGYPAANGPGTYMRAPPAVVSDLQWMGIDVVGAASNHTFDYSHGGIEATMDALESQELPFAGLGRNLAAARAPAYVETAAGRVGVVGACSTITTGSTAGRQRPDMQGRPGLAPLRTDVRYTVPEPMFDHVQEMSEQLGLEALKRRLADLGFPLTDPDADPFRLLCLDGDRHPAIEPGDEYAVTRQPREADIEALETQIDVARRQADWVIASLHAHEGAGAATTDESVPEFLRTVAHRLIDAGADAVIGHGSHVLRGIELYDDAPVFYSLGNVFAQTETIDRLPADLYAQFDLGPDASPADLYDQRMYDSDGDPAGFLAMPDYWESVIPVCTYRQGSLSGIELHPIDLRRVASRGMRGIPRPADDDQVERILERLRDRSTPFGTDIQVRDGVGHVVVD